MYTQAISILSNQFTFLHPSDFSLSDECRVMLVGINPISKHRAFVNYASIIIVIV